jgi:hypothetical protein
MSISSHYGSQILNNSPNKSRLHTKPRKENRSAHKIKQKHKVFDAFQKVKRKSNVELAKYSHGLSSFLY